MQTNGRIICGGNDLTFLARQYRTPAILTVKGATNGEMDLPAPGRSFGNHLKIVARVFCRIIVCQLLKSASGDDQDSVPAENLLFR